MDEIFPNLYKILPSKQTPSKYLSFFIKQEKGNWLVPCFSNSSTIEASFDAIAAVGGLKGQLLGDSHFKTAHCDEVAERFNAPLYCSEGEAPDITRTVKQVVVFPFKRHLLDTDLEIIPTPGHRPGGVCYLVTLNGRKYLFVGDFVWHNGEDWIPTASKAGHKAYIDSLHLLNELEFDVLLSNSKLSNPIFSVEFDQHSRKTFIDRLLKQLQ